MAPLTKSVGGREPESRAPPSCEDMTEGLAERRGRGIRVLSLSCSTPLLSLEFWPECLEKSFRHAQH